MDFSGWVNQSITWVGQYPELLAITIFLVSFLESLVIIGIFIPGVVLLFGLAALCGGGALSLESTLFAAFLGAVAGDGLSFYVGRRYSTQTQSIWPLTRYPELIIQSERFFKQHGGKSVVIGRFVGPLRCFLPLAVGALGMPPSRFIAFNVASAIAWAPWYILPGFLVGAAIDIETPLPQHFYPVLGSLLLIIVLTAGLFTQLHWHLRPSGSFYRWISNRFETSGFAHRLWDNLYSLRNGEREYPISSALLFTGGVFGFAFVTLLTLYLPSVQQLNLTVAGVLTDIHIPLLDMIFVGLTLLGNPGFLYLFFGWFVTLLVVRQRFHLAFLCILGGLSAHALTSFLKAVLQIQRPDSPGIPDSFAYPSGHTSGAILVYGLITAFIARERLPHHRWGIYVTGGIWVLLIACSRLYLQVHWLSDIVGGTLLGLTLCGLIRTLQSPYDRQPVWTDKWIAVFGFGAAILVISYLLLTFPAAIARFQLFSG
ncbi:membrane-associated protein [Hahella sp. CCB-MM4]|uniref:bifunctional DedA family/phosphatase PAP2 family protein n=1 Tax=Hahella sp. (strain CCB-MM4) TaxID=1926491 RepID=UPI000B9A55EA|nr:bifunctional DedA family/phosphatase PAP2 family protein [Hahella sp. CCB-MM4]OZG71958.1 membrane-associated protein [Hahella sp. CCB-MM4]